jgi:2-polyprenyl-3-methyl-5-hydroxy-6-metoxy-1,4-benzoquinol methylase
MNLHATPSCDCCGADDWTYLFTENSLSLGCCAECRLHYVRPMPSLRQRITEMESSHFAGSLVTSRAEVHLAQERQIRLALESYVALAHRFAPAGKWLDIGCGTGTFMTLVRARGIESEGIELTRERRDVALRETGGPVYDQPLEDLDLPPSSFAAVTLINVFSHLTSPTETLTCIRRVLMPDGIILLRTGEIGPNVRKRHVYSWDLGDHLYFLGEQTAERYAAKLKFQLIHRERAWVPATVYTRERFMLKGRSRLRNAIKGAIVGIPGAMPILRWYMLTLRDAANPMYDSTLVLRKVD